MTIAVDTRWILFRVIYVCVVRTYCIIDVTYWVVFIKSKWMLGDNSIFAPASCSSHSLLFDSYLNSYGSYFQCNSLKNGWLKTFGIFL